MKATTRSSRKTVMAYLYLGRALSKFLTNMWRVQIRCACGHTEKLYSSPFFVSSLLHNSGCFEIEERLGISFPHPSWQCATTGIFGYDARGVWFHRHYWQLWLGRFEFELEWGGTDQISVHGAQAHGWSKKEGWIREGSSYSTEIHFLCYYQATQAFITRNRVATGWMRYMFAS